MMRISKVLIAGTIAFLILSGFLVSVSESAAPQYTIKLATIAPEGSYWSDFFQKIKNYVESRSRGRARIVWYMSGVMGDEPDVIKKMKTGEVNGAVLTIIGLGIMQPDFRALMLPFLIKNYEEVDYILDSMYPRFKQMAEEKGFVLMGFTEVGFNRVYTRDPIRSYQDYTRLKMWGWEGEEIIQLIFQEDLDVASVTPISLYGVKKALEQGTINSCYAPCYAQLGLQWYKHANYMSDFGFGYTPGAFVIDKKFFQSLPSDIQYILQQALDFVLKPLRQIVREEEEKACQGLIKRGIKEFGSSSPELMAEFERRSQGMFFKWADRGKYPRDLMQEIMDNLNEFRSR